MIAPPGSITLGLPDAPTLCLGDVRIAYACLLDLARLGRHGLAVRTLPDGEDILTPALPVGASIYSESVPVRSRPEMHKPLPGQLTLF